MNQDFNLTPKDILEKDFKIDTRGFRPQEVDKFLDQIIADYNEYNNIIKELRREISLLRDENAKLKNELRRLKDNISAAEGSSGGNVSNLDLLRRLSQLEKIVYAHEMKGSKVVTEEDQEVKEEKEEKKKKEKEDK